VFSSEHFEHTKRELSIIAILARGIDRKTNLVSVFCLETKQENVRQLEDRNNLYCILCVKVFSARGELGRSLIDRGLAVAATVNRPGASPRAMKLPTHPHLIGIAKRLRHSE
jgi:hypothetical protein